MRLKFTKMQGAGNDFVVLDAMRAPIELSAAQWRALADRHFGVGADQILLVEPADEPGIDFRYRIFNADGGEVEQCGNGARCFARFVHDRGLTDKRSIRVRTLSGVIEPRIEADGRVTVDMGAPVFDPALIPFQPSQVTERRVGDDRQWRLALPESEPDDRWAQLLTREARWLWLSALSMGNPHAVLRVGAVDEAPVAVLGPWLEHHAAFPSRVNAGFMQRVDRGHLRLRVWERGAGETLACGTGACAAVVAGIRAGELDRQVDVQARGGILTIEWQGGSVMMTGPAVTVFEGEIDLPVDRAAISRGDR